MLAREGDCFISLLGTLARGDTLGGAGIRSWTKPARGVTTGIEGSSARGVSPCMVGARPRGSQRGLVVKTRSFRLRCVFTVIEFSRLELR